MLDNRIISFKLSEAILEDNKDYGILPLGTLLVRDKHHIFDVTVKRRQPRIEFNVLGYRQFGSYGPEEISGHFFARESIPFDFEGDMISLGGKFNIRRIRIISSTFEPVPINRYEYIASSIEDKEIIEYAAIRKNKKEINFEF